MIDAPLSEAASPRTSSPFASSDEVRARFASAMSAMYRSEVPQYGTLVDLVAEVNAAALRHDPGLLPAGVAEMARLDVERHGAIRLGTPDELSTIRRIFAVMGMAPVGYYDLSVAGVPVHSTAFRPVTQGALRANPFRVFTSLLRLELIRDPELRHIAAQILGRRSIFSARALQLTAQFEAQGGLSRQDAGEFVQEVLHTFRWHGAAAVSRADYQRLHDAHRLIADVVCFKGPHINHLTPRTLDIDAAQAEMPRRGIVAKDVIEGPPRRKVPILLRQTSFKALEEQVSFAGDGAAQGAHTARFGEIEQRGIALTRAGRTLYDTLLERARSPDGAAHADGGSYEARLAKVFEAFPDDLDTLRRDGLGFFRYALRAGADLQAAAGQDLDALVEQGIVEATPITYEDFLPVSAAGIFQSNLADGGLPCHSATATQRQFEAALGAKVLDEISLYEAEQAASIERTLRQLGRGAVAE
jgi:uncharacterized glyoxalase superfamily metalloenzyme YdcJ